MLDKILSFFKKLIPRRFFTWAQPIYHYTLALLGAIIYRFPSRKLTVVAVTGTKGKTSTTEIIGAILEEAGFKVAVSNTVRFKVAEESEDNLYKMSMPGRFFMQKFLRRAVRAGCQYAVIEITSEGARMHRNKFISLDALVFTNLAPEHIESHGSYENYVEAKLSIAKALAKSPKKRRIIIANADDKEGVKFLNSGAPEKYPYSLKDAEPWTTTKTDSTLTVDKTEIHSPLSGEFNIYNMLGAITFAKTQSIGMDTVKRALEKFSGIRGRVERVEAGQDFTVIVDYAHTPDSLEKLYQVFQDTRRICVLGNTGGGRDTWKRAVMAQIAAKHCDDIILTNEDPYDEDPRKIVEEMARAMTEKKPEIIMDRREAIRTAITKAKTGDSVLITGKGTDPYIMGANGTKLPWSDYQVAKEEIGKKLSAIRQTSPSSPQERSWSPIVSQHPQSQDLSEA